MNMQNSPICQLQDRCLLQCVRPMVGLSALVRKAHVYEILLKLMTSVDTYV